MELNEWAHYELWVGRMINVDVIILKIRLNVLIRLMLHSGPSPFFILKCSVLMTSKSLLLQQDGHLRETSFDYKYQNALRQAIVFGLFFFFLF